jgi:hypothetical protein
MIELYVFAGIALIIGGALVGTLTVLAAGIRREEKAYTFTIGSPSRSASGARAANGLYVRLPGVTQQVTRHA